MSISAIKYKLAGYYKRENWLAAVTYGWSENDSITTANLGRNRLKDWVVEYLQAEVTHTNFYIKWAHIENDAGKTFGIQNVPPFLAAGIPYETIISDPNLALIFDDSAMDDIEGQFNFGVGPLEVGYRGIWGGNLVVDTVAYTSKYENFISALQLIAHALLFGTVAMEADGNVHPVVLTYLNYGQADVDGFDIGIDYFRGRKFHHNLSYGYQKLQSFDNTTPIPDLPFNTPEWKIKGTLSLRDIWLENTLMTLGLRHVDEYGYFSGRWNGVIENSTFVDLTLGYRWVDKDTLFKFNVNNILDEDKTELIGVPAMPLLVSFEVFKKF